MAIDDTVTQEEWTPVYEKSLLMAKKLGFFDFGKRKIHGENVFCIFPSEEMDYNGETGWRVIGRFPEYKRAEDQFMPKHLPDSQFYQYPYDMLRTRFPEQIEQTEEQHGFEYIWGNKTQGEPYHMGLLAIFTYRDAVNPAIDRYIPLNEIRAVLTEQFGSVVNVNEIIDNYLTEEENRTEAIGHELLMKEGQEYSKKWDEDHKQYDICEFEELIEFTPDSTFSPEMTEVIAKSFKVCLDCAATPECKALLDKSADEMFHVLVSKFKSFYLADKHWEHIYSELCRDTQTFKRFYPIIRVTHSEKLEYLVRAFVLDDTFWNYCCEHFSKEVSDELDQTTDTQEGS